MTQFDFDQPIERRGTSSMKWDALSSRYKMDPENSIAMWVADMEFRAPSCVRERLQGMIDHGVFGYYGDDSGYRASIVNWMDRRHGWAVDPANIYTTHGVVHGLSMCLQAFTDPGDGIIVFSPAYHMFAGIIRSNQRDLIESPLAERQDGRYEMDLDTLEGQLTGKEKMVFFCSPHNPGGRVWERSEIEALAKFCEKHDLILVSDEIHHDLIMPGHKHHITATVAPDIAHKLVTLSSASKTFNLAGGHVGQAVITDENLRAKFDKVKTADAVGPNSFGVVVTQAAYELGEEWLEALLVYLDENRKLFDATIAGISGAKSMPLEATYLSWADFRNCDHDRDEVIRRVEKEAGIATNYGATFGEGGEGRLRFNIACPRAQLEEAMDRVKAAFA
ncbi:MalY/PatB family protein [Ahrensia sp. R2A130]|uniref:MalY/PatB family protein n=1 Tax=Ahrensia sp. R2A130 TaxID=744979 RepID=UPI0001E083DE|nr:MalY/PatB family protein [Ahrensia sp. R2A130]EFL89521.1 putative aminotransferase B [Ahrensia sp. R2A130]